MKKFTAFFSVLCLILSLTACNGEGQSGSGQDAPSKTAQPPESVVKPTGPAATPKVQTPAAVTPEAPKATPSPDTPKETAAPEPPKDTVTKNGIDPYNPPVNWGTPDGPQIAAEKYYAGTVFELVSLTVKESSREHVIFTVSSKKGGVPVDPDRTIELQYKDDAWIVINEGY